MLYIQRSTITVLWFLYAMWEELRMMVSSEGFVQNRVRFEQTTATKLLPVISSGIIIMITSCHFQFKYTFYIIMSLPQNPHTTT